MTTSRNSKSPMETARSVRATKLASKNHSSNEVAPKTPDLPPVNAHPLWDMATLLATACDPTQPLNSERIEAVTKYLANSLESLDSPKHEVDLLKSRSVVLRSLADRMLFLASANQSDPSLVKAYVDCYERLATASERELGKAKEISLQATRRVLNNDFDHEDLSELRDLILASGRKEFLKKLEKIDAHIEATCR